MTQRQDASHHTSEPTPSADPTKAQTSTVPVPGADSETLRDRQCTPLQSLRPLQFDQRRHLLVLCPAHYILPVPSGIRTNVSITDTERSGMKIDGVLVSDLIQPYESRRGGR
jgi:hypothetical protein